MLLRMMGLLIFDEDETTRRKKKEFFVGVIVGICGSCDEMEDELVV